MVQKCLYNTTIYFYNTTCLVNKQGKKEDAYKAYEIMINSQWNRLNKFRQNHR